MATASTRGASTEVFAPGLAANTSVDAATSSTEVFAPGSW